MCIPCSGKSFRHMTVVKFLDEELENHDHVFLGLGLRSHGAMMLVLQDWVW